MALIRLNKDSIIYEFDPSISSSILGRGGMGVVFKGRRVDRETGHIESVAIKVLFKELPEESLTRARREASIQIEHENIIRMYGCVDVVDAENNVTCHVISEYLDGETLDKSLMRGETLSESDAIKIVRSVLSGLYMFHEKGFIHRDIDPSNVMMCKNGRIKLIDFGIAKSLKEYHDEFRQGTQEGKFIGKVNYASPEQAQGLHWTTNTTSDIYSTGILLFELLTGKLPFSGTTYEVIKCHIDSPIVFENSSININLQHIISKATAKLQEDRYQTVSEFIVDLEKYEKGARIPAPKFKKRKDKTSSKSKIVWIVSLILIVVILFGGAVTAIIFMQSESISGAQKLVQYGQYDQAITKYNEATKLFAKPSTKHDMNLLEDCNEALSHYYNLSEADSMLMNKFIALGDDGFADAYYYAAELCIDGVTARRDIEFGVETLMKGAQCNSILSDYRLGEVYFKGEKVTKDEAKANEYFTKARQAIEEYGVENLSPELLYVYGKMFSYGYSVEFDYLQAKVLLERAAIEGNSAAYYELYLLHNRRKSYSDAADYLDKAVEAGYTKAEYEYAMSLTNKHYYSKAMPYYEKAAAKRYAPAYYQLAIAYRYGRNPKKIVSREKYIEYMQLAVLSDSDFSAIKNEVNAYNKSMNTKPAPKPKPAPIKAKPAKAPVVKKKVEEKSDEPTVVFKMDGDEPAATTAKVESVEKPKQQSEPKPAKVEVEKKEEKSDVFMWEN